MVTLMRERRRRGIYILPALFTTGNLFFGFFAIVEAINGRLFEAAIGLILAGFFDLLDGRVARLTNTTSQFGGEYDSLADMVSFGLAPAIMLYTWALQPFGKVGWLASFLYAACAALRLARFNVQSETDERRYFHGLSTPGGAAVVCTSVLFFRDVGANPAFRQFYVPLIIMVLALLMVSNIRYRSFKQLDFRSPRAPWVLLVMVAAITVIAAAPAKTLFAMAIAYAVSGPLEGVLSMRRDRRVRAARERRKKNAVRDG
ncbi:MAG: CDP-diacylglycerol--serine O-phosphatidyltransferase [Myxococcota bacterium]